MMAFGEVLAAAGLGLPFVEAGIALSVVVIGAALAFGATLPLALATALAGGFAVFHGVAILGGVLYKFQATAAVAAGRCRRRPGPDTAPRPGS